MDKKRKKRHFDLIPPPREKKPCKPPRKLDLRSPQDFSLDDLDDMDDIDQSIKREGGSHRRVDPSPDEIWGPGGLAQEAREYFANKKLDSRGEFAGKKISKTERDRDVMEKLLDPLGLFGPIKIDVDADTDD